MTWMFACLDFKNSSFLRKVACILCRACGWVWLNHGKNANKKYVIVLYAVGSGYGSRTATDNTVVCMALAAVCLVTSIFLLNL